MIVNILLLIVAVALTMVFSGVAVVVYNDYKDMSKYEKSLLRTKITIVAFSIMIVLFGFTMMIIYLNLLSGGII